MWKVNYHIVFELINGKIIQKNNSINIKNPQVNTAKEAENYILKKYKHSFQPLVNKDDIFMPIKKEKFVIECIKQVS